MTSREQIRSTLHDSLRANAPEVDPAWLASNADLREELDLDSMDFLNCVTHESCRCFHALDCSAPASLFRHTSVLVNC